MPEVHVFELIKMALGALFSWPTVTLVLVLIFRGQILSAALGIGEATKRGLKVKAAGFDFDFSAAAQSTAEAMGGLTADLPPVTGKVDTVLAATTLSATAVVESTELTSSPPDQDLRGRISGIQVNGAVLAREMAIRQDLAKAGYLLGASETSELLVRHLSVAQFQRDSERRYRSIFGSQIAALKLLNVSGPSSAEALRPIYEAAAANFVEQYKNFPFAVWLAFLSGAILIGPAAVDKDRIEITLEGKEFLKWMTDAAATEYRPL